jgi:hypothetical protein
MTRSRLVFGLVLIALGVLLLLDQAQRLSAWEVVADWWPTIVIACGVAQLVTRPRNTLSGVVLSVLGGVLLLWSLGVIASVAVVWPVLLIAAGLWLLAGRLGRAGGRRAGALEVHAIVDDREEAAAPGPFPGGSVTALLGDVELDLSRATLDADGATLDVITVFGDVELTIPAAWEVTATGPELFGDVVLRRASSPPTDAPVLRLRVFTVFGDVEVRNAAGEASSPAVAPGRLTVDH